MKRQIRQTNRKGAISPQMIAVIGAIIILAFVFGLFGTGSIMGIPQAPPQEKPFMFDGISGTAKSTYFGQISNTGGIPFQTVKEGFCGNDGDVQLSNSLNDGNTLTLSSSISSNTKTCGTNGIIIESVTFPKGRLSGNCGLSADESSDGSSTASCSVWTVGFSTTYHHDCKKGQSNVNQAFWNTNCKGSENKNFAIDFDKETTIKIILTTQSGYTGSASASLTLNFEPATTETQTTETGQTIPGQTQPSQIQNKTLWDSIKDFFNGILGWFRR